VLKDEPDVDPNDQASVLEHLDKVVRGKSLVSLGSYSISVLSSWYLNKTSLLQVRDLIEKSRKTAVSKSELKLPLIRIKVLVADKTVTFSFSKFYYHKHVARVT